MKHYKLINEVLKRLDDIHFEPVKSGFESIFRDYRIVVLLPDEMYHYNSACLHVKRENADAAEALASLRTNLRAHRDKVDSAEVDFIEKVNNAFESRNLTYDRTGNLFDNVIHLLSIGWRAYNGDLVKSSDKARLLDYFEREFFRHDVKDALYLGGARKRLVWQGSEDEKDRVIESIKAVLVDSTILTSLNELESSKSSIETSVGQIRKTAKRISEAIDADGYTATAKCCPTILGTIWNYLLGE